MIDNEEVFTRISMYKVWSRSGFYCLDKMQELNERADINYRPTLKLHASRSCRHKLV